MKKAARQPILLLTIFTLVILVVTAVALKYWPTTHLASNTSTPTPEGKSQQQGISTMFIPHHDIVKQIRQQFLAKIGPSITPPQTIILLSPNHYEVGLGNVQTSDQSWKLTDQTIQPNFDVIAGLSDLATIQPDSFANEHGVKLVLADIWQTFPKAKIVPLIFKRATTKEQVERLNQKLVTDCQKCLLIASEDFSHYQTALLANLHDNFTQRAMEQLDVDQAFTQAEVDSPAVLALAMAWAKSHQTEKLVVYDHTNSGVITAQPYQETTTHFFAYYTEGEKVSSIPAVSFLIGGDMMFGRMIAHTFLAKGLWKSVELLGERLFWGTDAGIVNLEGPVSATPVPDDIRSNNLTFNFPPQTIGALQYLHINVASQANNHSANAGLAGLETTRALLKKALIRPLGDPSGFDESHTVSIKGNKLTLDILGVHTLVSQPDLTPTIKKLKADPTHRVMIFYHGGVEYAATHSASQQELAHQWIDAGADIVIGAHPHVVEDAELYKGKPIFYSLGNLLFDQTFSTETQQGLLVAGQFTDKSLQLFALPTQSKKNQPTVVLGEAQTARLKDLYRPFGQYLKETPAGTVLDIPN